QECFAAGMDGFLSKPVSIEKLPLLLQDTAERRARHTAAAAIDPTVIARLFELGTQENENFANEIIDSFLADTASVLASMRESVAAQDAARLHVQAHTLKGSSGIVGALSLASLCRELED